MLVAAKHAAANNKIYCVNISAPFLLQVFTKNTLSPTLALHDMLKVISKGMYHGHAHAAAIQNSCGLRSCRVCICTECGMFTHNIYAQAFGCVCESTYLATQQDAMASAHLFVSSGTTIQEGVHRNYAIRRLPLW